jgi:1,4-alpha-glucan branching enzyme
MTAKTVELTEMDLFLHGEGTHYRAYQKLGAHPCERDGQGGVFFAVWAPSARQVGVAGDFNGWDRDRDRLVPQGSSGIWAGFVAGAAVGSLYKFMIEGAHGELLEKSDPYGFAAE